MKDTIAAIATPPGQGGVGIVRVSGSGAREIGERLFCSSREGFSGLLPYRLHYGELVDSSGVVLDDVLVAFMPGPNSYTGEDVVEFHCHGGTIPGTVLEAVFALGARPAERGEFTYRAFLNGRMDLTQAEAVAEMIAAPSRAGADMARTRQQGLLGRKIGELRTRLEQLRAELCVAVDFPEDEVECLSPERLESETREVSGAIAELVADHERFRCWREGATVVLAGRVNAGKSSLLNALAGRERAIVTDLPGTTRDYIEEAVNLDGLAVRLIDTAGLRETGDAVELIGVERSRELLGEADLVLLVLDATAQLEHVEQELVNELDADRLLVVINKCDLDSGDSGSQLAVLEDFLTIYELQSVRVSAKSGVGLETLAKSIRERIAARSGEPEQGRLVPNLRQTTALKSALEELEGLIGDTQAGIPYDLLGVRLEAACNILAEITGDITPDAILNSIFDSFCIGK